MWGGNPDENAADKSSGISAARMLHSHLVATTVQDTQWWAARWIRPVGISVHAGVSVALQNSAATGRRVAAAGCILVNREGKSESDYSFRRREGYNEGGGSSAKEAAAGLKEQAAALQRRGALLGRCCKQDVSTTSAAPEL
jgi:hypothetical protein